VLNYQLHFDKTRLKSILHEKCDWILLDVPCTGSGTLRRNPDMKWKFSLNRLEELLEIQGQIFEESLDLLKPDGRIAYTTCSILQEENLNQVVKFCQRYGMKIENDNVFQTLPKSRQMDGFFSVTLIKK
jgi:16S rRNA (cytosine967-C5)-methyltransferase